MRPKKQVFPITRTMNYVDVMKTESDRRGIIITDFMRLLGHTQTETASRMLKGLSEPRASQLATICTKFNFNMLDFFEYNGYRFETDIEDLYRMERLGIKVSDILLAHRVKPIDRDKDAVKSEEDSERYMCNVENMIKNSVANDKQDTERVENKLTEQVAELAKKLEDTLAELKRARELNDGQQTLLLDQQETIKYLRGELQELKKK